MKNKRFKLSELKVDSFVTDLSKDKENTVKGGAWTTIPPTLTILNDFCQVHSLDGFCEKHTESICPTRDVKCNDA